MKLQLIASIILVAAFVPFVQGFPEYMYAKIKIYGTSSTQVFSKYPYGGAYAKDIAFQFEGTQDTYNVYGNKDMPGFSSTHRVGFSQNNGNDLVIPFYFENELLKVRVSQGSSTANLRTNVGIGVFINANVMESVYMFGMTVFPIPMKVFNEERHNNVALFRVCIYPEYNAQWNFDSMEHIINFEGFENKDNSHPDYENENYICTNRQHPPRDGDFELVTPKPDSTKSNSRLKQKPKSKS